MIDGRGQLIPAHSITIIRPGTTHQLASDGGWAVGLQLLQFDPQWLAQGDQATMVPLVDRVLKMAGLPMAHRTHSDQRLRAQLITLQQHIAGRDPVGCRDTLATICQDICHWNPVTPLGSGPAPTKGASVTGSGNGRPQLEQVLSFIDRNLARPISRQELARQASFAPSYFSALFRESTGVTIPEYINLRRVHRAKELLSQPEMRVSTVCYAVGFRDLSNFNRVFKRVTGCTPREFREQIHGVHPEGEDDTP